MLRGGLALSLTLLTGVAGAQTDHPPSALSLASQLAQISLDPARTFRVRDLTIARGDIKFYFNEGVIGFFTPVNGHTIAAVFTTEGTEAGDAEVILMPPLRSERASLASFAKSPNLDEHFPTAIFFFTDNTAQDLIAAINRAPVREATDVASAISPRADAVAREIAGQLEVPLIEALLDNHPAQDGILYSVIRGSTLGPFDVNYNPTLAESVFVGRVSKAPGKPFELWTNFRPRRAPAFLPPESRVRQYRIESTIHPDLSMDVAAIFRLKTEAADGRVIPLALSPRLKVASAKVDGATAEIFQRPAQRLSDYGGAETLLLVSDDAFVPGEEHQIELRYAGSVIRQTPSGEYFVDDRNTWYPVYGPVSADFDLTFHCPERLRLVSTGEPVSETVENGIRTVHRKTTTPATLAGFNLGNYSVRREQHNEYAIEIDSPNTPASALTADPTLPRQTADILDAYTKRWRQLPSRNLAVSPIAGYFGQGFPGLIYLSSVAYVKEESRALSLRGPRFDAFFSELLLPHEIAHQWWGNIVRQADYRSSWITEAMANLSALDYAEQTKGAHTRDDILESYRQDLTREQDGKTVESAGPVDFGERLIETYGFATWQIILYEKGSWILHMLRERLGDDNFRQMQLRLLRDYAARPLSNDELRAVASSFVPQGQPDRTLNNFFDTWVYGTGIPGLALRPSGPRTLNLRLTDVGDDFLLEIPLRCKQAGTYWVKAGAGENNVELPKDAPSCELPSPRNFLYLPARKQ